MPRPMLFKPITEHGWRKNPITSDDGKTADLAADSFTHFTMETWTISTESEIIMVAMAT